MTIKNPADDTANALTESGLRMGWAKVAATALQARADAVDSDISSRSSSSAAPGPPGNWTVATASPTVAFAFSGQGAEYAGMGRALYEASSLFRKHVNELWDNSLALDEMEDDGIDVAAITRTLCGRHPEEDDFGTSLGSATITQPLVCLVQLALDAFLREVVGPAGQPVLVAGHSLGEFAALSSAGAAKSDGQGESAAHDILRLVASRGRATDEHSSDGGMLSVVMPQGELRLHLERLDLDRKISVAVCNSNLYNVVAGPDEIRDDVGAQPSQSEEVLSTALGGDWEFRGVRPPHRG